MAWVCRGTPFRRRAGSSIRIAQARVGSCCELWLFSAQFAPRSDSGRSRTELASVVQGGSYSQSHPIYHPEAFQNLGHASDQIAAMILRISSLKVITCLDLKFYRHRDIILHISEAGAFFVTWNRSSISILRISGPVTTAPEKEVLWACVKCYATCDYGACAV